MKFKFLVIMLIILVMAYFFSNYVTKDEEERHNKHIDLHLNFWHKSKKLMIMSYNIRSSNIDTEGKHKWSNRKMWVAETLNHYRPDIISTQEGLKPQLLELSKMIPGYWYIGLLKDIKPEDENLVIFYNKNTIRPLKNWSLLVK